MFGYDRRQWCWQRDLARRHPPGSQPGQSIMKPPSINDQPTDAHNLVGIALTAMVATCTSRPLPHSSMRRSTDPVHSHGHVRAHGWVGTGPLMLMALRCVALERSRRKADESGGAWLIESSPRWP